MNWIRYKALVKKELIEIARDPSSIVIALILPLILLFLYGAGVSLDSRGLKVGLALEDDSPIATSLAETFQRTWVFSIEISKDKEELFHKLQRGDLKAVVVIPFYFTRDFLAHEEPAPIQVIADGSEPNTATFVQNYSEGIFSKWRQIQEAEFGQKPNPGVRLEPRVWFNEELRSNYFLIPGSFAIILSLTGTLLTSLVVAKEWERGSMEALMATQCSMKEILLGKLTAYFILGVGSLFVCFFVSHFIFLVPFQGSFLLLLLVSIAFLLYALGMGLLISSITRNQFAASQAAVIVSFLPSFILSGFLFEITSMPWILQVFSYMLPARYYVQSTQTLYLAGNIYKLILPNLLILLLFALLFFFLSLKGSKKRLD